MGFCPCPHCAVSLIHGWLLCPVTSGLFQPAASGTGLLFLPLCSCFTPLKAWGAANIPSQLETGEFLGNRSTTKLLNFLPAVQTHHQIIVQLPCRMPDVHLEFPMKGRAKEAGLQLISVCNLIGLCESHWELGMLVLRTQTSRSSLPPQGHSPAGPETSGRCYLPAQQVLLQAKFQLIA